MLNEVKHPYWIPRYARNDIACHAERKRKRSEAFTRWIYLTLFRFHRNVPLLFEGEGQQGEVCHPQPVMLSVVKHPYWIPHWRSE